jgi:hypothetical protein
MVIPPDRPDRLDAQKSLAALSACVANAFADKVSRLRRVGRSTMAVETLDQNQRQRSQYIDFWNNVLLPKFIRWKHILVDGLTLHSEAIFPTRGLASPQLTVWLGAVLSLHSDVQPPQHVGDKFLHVLMAAVGEGDASALSVGRRRCGGDDPFRIDDDGLIVRLRELHECHERPCL